MKVKSGQEPDTFKVKQAFQNENETNSLILIRWDVSQVTTETIDGEKSTGYEYNEESITLNIDDKLSSSEIKKYAENHEAGILREAKAKHKRKVETEKERIDKDTGETISAKIHPEAQEREEIGILRNQIVSITNELGLDTTEGFEELNQIAIEEINKGIDRKEDL